MAQTDFRSNFSTLSDGEIVLWQKKTWMDARDKSFWSQFMGGSDSPVQMVDDLNKDKGETVVTQLVHDLVTDGVVGDTEREGREEAINSNDMRTTIDIISHQVANIGKLSDQKSVINFREQANDKLSYWHANRMDQLMFLTASGIAYTKNTDGSTRASTEFSKLAFADDVSPPTSKRKLRVTGDTVDSDGDTAAITAGDVLTYGALLDAVAYADEHYVKRINEDGQGYYVVVLHPTAYTELKKDADYQNAVINGLPRSESNPWFTGRDVTVDGIVLKQHRLSYNTRGLASGSKYGASGTVDGNRGLILGSQAMVYANVGDMSWVEEQFQYKSRYGISVDKMCGMRKSVFDTIYDKDANGDPTSQDFGIVTLDMAMPIV